MRGSETKVLSPKQESEQEGTVKPGERKEDGSACWKTILARALSLSLIHLWGGGWRE